MISLSRAARLPCEEVSPDVSLSGSVCISSALGSGRECAGLGRVAGDGVVTDSTESWIAVSVVGVASPASLCERNSDPVDRACTAARMGPAQPWSVVS